MSSIMERGSVWLIDGVYHISKGKHEYEKDVYVFENTDTGAVYGTEWEAMKQNKFCHKASTIDEAILYVNKVKRSKDTEANTEGQKFDTNKPQMDLVFNGFPNALIEVGKNATFGAQKYTPHGWKAVPNGIPRYTAAMYRHLLAEAKGELKDKEFGLHHATMAAWNALARLELILQAESKTTPNTIETPKPDPELKPGDFIKITKPSGVDLATCFKVGDQAKLLSKVNGVWFADFNYNIDVVYDGKWFLTEGSEFVKIDKPEPLPEPKLHPEPEFKLGDYVKVVDTSDGMDMWCSEGDIGVIVSHGAGTVDVDFNNCGNSVVVGDGIWSLYSRRIVLTDKPELPPEVIDPALFVDGAKYDYTGKCLLDGTASIEISACNDTSLCIAIFNDGCLYSHTHYYSTYTEALTAIQNLINELNK